MELPTAGLREPIFSTKQRNGQIMVTALLEWHIVPCPSSLTTSMKVCLAGPQGIARRLTFTLSCLGTFISSPSSPLLTSKGPLHGLGRADLYLSFLGAGRAVWPRQLTSTRFHQLPDSHCPGDSLRKTYYQFSALEHSSSFCLHFSVQTTSTVFSCFS